LFSLKIIKRALQFQDEGLVHKYFDVDSFPYDFKTERTIVVDGKIGEIQFESIVQRIIFLIPFKLGSEMIFPNYAVETESLGEWLAYYIQILPYL
jgi:hypothetical protein